MENMEASLPTYSFTYQKQNPQNRKEIELHPEEPDRTPWLPVARPEAAGMP